MQAAAFLDTPAETAAQQAKRSEYSQLRAPSRLKTVQRKARTGRNPQTGETIKIKAKTVAKFYVVQAVKDAIARAKRWFIRLQIE